MSQLLNETFQKHLKRLKKDLLIESDEISPTPSDVLTPEVKQEFWGDFKSTSVKDFVEKYGSKMTDPKFHAFITAGVADGIHDENFTVSQFSPKASELVPTQNEIGFGNSIDDLIKVTFNEGTQLEELKKILDGNNVMLGAGKSGTKIPVVVFADKYIIDGHHRWSKISCGNKDAKIACLNFNNPNLKGNVGMALKAFHLAIAQILSKFPVSDKSGDNLMTSDTKTVSSYVNKNITSKFSEVYKTEKQLPDNESIAKYISENASSTIIGKQGAADGGNLSRKYMPQTDQAPAYQAGLEKGEINFFYDTLTEKMVNETFQRHLTLLYKKLKLN